MSNFAIVADTACDLTKDLRKRFGVDDYVRGVLYHPDGTSEPCSLDWETMTAKEYYDSMKGRKALYTTATPPLGDVMNTFEKYLKEGRDVLSISLSAGLSSSWSNTENIAKELCEKYPERKIVCIDSERYSTALAVLVIEACLQRDLGKSIEEVAAHLDEVKHTIHQMGSMDDLFFLVKTGRVTNFKAFFGQMIGLNIMADFNEKGMSEVVGKIKGPKNMIDATIEYIKEMIVDPENQIMFVAHTNREAAAKLLAERIEQEIKPKEVIINTVGTACGATIGPGLCAAFFKGRPTSHDMADEKALMEKIIEAQKAK